MKGKILILLLVLISLLASGCGERDSGLMPEDSNTSIPKAEATEPVENTVSASGQEHIVRLEYYKVFRPSELEIKVGDTVSWWSDKRQGTYTLISKEELFPDTELAYSVPFSYTFNDPGTYTFTVKDLPEMNSTVKVV